MIPFGFFSKFQSDELNCMVLFSWKLSKMHIVSFEATDMFVLSLRLLVGERKCFRFASIYSQKFRFNIFFSNYHCPCHPCTMHHAHPYAYAFNAWKLLGRVQSFSVIIICLIESKNIAVTTSLVVLRHRFSGARERRCVSASEMNKFLEF